MDCLESGERVWLLVVMVWLLLSNLGRLVRFLARNQQQQQPAQVPGRPARRRRIYELSG